LENNLREGVGEGKEAYACDGENEQHVLLLQLSTLQKLKGEGQ
jgi:hypothetical protein